MTSTTVTLRVETRNRLKAAKRGGETYDELFNRLLEQDRGRPRIAEVR